MKPDLHIFLSYRQNTEDLQVREILVQLCKQQRFELIYDEKALQEHDNLNRFMNDLGSARCVLILLSPDYFKSAFTLYELIRIHENGNLDTRFVFPLRATKDMSNNVKTRAKNDCWLKDEAVRNELCGKLNEQDEDAVWTRVLNAWDAIIAPCLNTVNVSIEKAGIEKILAEKLETVRKIFETVIQEAHEKLCKTIQSEVCFFLEENNIPRKYLKHKLGLAQNTDTGLLAEALVREGVSNAIGIITGVVTDQYAQLKKDDRWNDALADAEQICGWLLIGSVDPVWWFHQQLKMKHVEKTDIRNHLTLENHAYAEVIISRSIPRNASFRLDKNRAVPSIDAEINAMAVFDASADAIGNQILSDIYKDLFKRNRDRQFSDEMTVEEIYRRVRALYKAKGKPVCYLLSRDILDLMEKQSWYAHARQKLTGYLQFIYCDIHSRDEAMKTMPTSIEEQDGLLGQIELLLSLKDR